MPWSTPSPTPSCRVLRVPEEVTVELLTAVPASTRSVRSGGRRIVEYDLPFEDWAISGTALRALIAARWGAPDPPQQMTALCAEHPDGAVASVRRLLGEVPPDFADGRVALLLCPIDNDLDCGAISTRVVRGADTVEWRDVGWQVTYEPFVPELDEFGPLPSFRFDRAQYEGLLRDLLSRYRAMPVDQPRVPDTTIGPRRRSWFRRR